MVFVNDAVKVALAVAATGSCGMLAGLAFRDWGVASNASEAS
jgi:hypothetical protein